MPWYKSGTVSVTQNSNAVIGTGTAFIANARVGDAFRGPDGGWYEVTNMASDTAMSISPNYQGATNAAGVYALAPMQGYVKDSADALRALVNEFGTKLAALGTTGNYEILPVEKGGTGASTATAALTALGVSTFVKTILDDVNAAAVLATLGVSTFAKTLLDDLDAPAALATLGVSDFAKTLLDDVDLSTAQTTLGISAFMKTLLDDVDAPAARVTLQAAEQTKGFIEGLTISWNSATSVTISAGSAYVPSVGKVVTYAGGTITPGAVIDVNTFLHLYLAATGTIEQALTAPVRYYSQAHQKTGDTSRRYIGSLHVTTNAAGVSKFLHNPQRGEMLYTKADPTSTPFRMLVTGTGIGSFSTSAFMPVTGHSILAAFQSSGATNCSFTPSDAGTSITTGWIVFISPGSIQQAICPVTVSDKTITYSAGAGSTNVYGIGYYFDR